MNRPITFEDAVTMARNLAERATWRVPIRLPSGDASWHIVCLVNADEAAKVAAAIAKLQGWTVTGAPELHPMYAAKETP